MKNKIEIDGEVYVLKSSLETPRQDGKDYVVIRSRESGCHAGYLASRNGSEDVLHNARRLWYWSGAASLSQLAMEGVSNPDECKFPAPVNEITVLGVCEIINATAQANLSIESVTPWTA